MSKFGWLTFVISAMAAVGCSAKSDSVDSELVGTAEARITSVPTGVGCIRVLAAGPLSVTRDFSVTPGQSATLSLTKLPTGSVTFSGSAFNTACSPVLDPSTASWTASGVAATVTAGVTGTVNLVFQPTGNESVNATFADGSDGGAVGPTTWDPAWSVAGVTYSNGNLSISGNTINTKNVRTTVGRSYGKWYWEITATAGDGTTDAGGLGILESATPNNVPWIGDAPSGISFGYGSCCATTYWTTWSGVTLSSSGPPLSSAVKAGAVYTFALDMDTGRFWAGQDGTWYNGGDPASGTNPAATGLTGTVYPGVTFYNNSLNAFTANFGATAFVNAVPAGFNAGFY
jgi:hypothetical protein